MQKLIIRLLNGVKAYLFFPYYIYVIHKRLTQLATLTQQTQKDIAQTKRSIESTKKNIEHIKKDGRQTKIDVELTNVHVVQIQRSLELTNSYVEQTKKEIILTRSDVELIKSVVELTKREVTQTKKDIGHTKKEASYIKLIARRIHAKQDVDFKQTEALFSLITSLKPNRPFPGTRGWAASPDLLKKIIEIIFEKKPKLVVEASSGVSTLAIAYALKENNVGKVISLEHEEKYKTISENNIIQHNLESISRILFTPLKQYKINNIDWLWYDLTDVAFDEKIDVLIVDGPPGNIQYKSRYPALPLLIDHLSEDALIILDDTIRAEEKSIVEDWKNILIERGIQYIESKFSFEKGACVLQLGSAHKTNPLLVPTLTQEERMAFV